nr:MAG TPA: hypothetical protein [Caudoviricetes sp.]
MRYRHLFGFSRRSFRLIRPIHFQLPWKNLP